MCQTISGVAVKDNEARVKVYTLPGEDGHEEIRGARIIKAAARRGKECE
jgi:hypothetical protein